MVLERMHFLASGIILGLKKRSPSNLSFWQQGQPFIIALICQLLSVNARSFSLTSRKHKLLFFPEFPLKKQVLAVVKYVPKYSQWELLCEAVNTLAA